VPPPPTLPVLLNAHFLHAVKKVLSQKLEKEAPDHSALRVTNRFQVGMCAPSFGICSPPFPVFCPICTAWMSSGRGASRRILTASSVGYPASCVARCGDAPRPMWPGTDLGPANGSCSERLVAARPSLLPEFRARGDPF